MELSHAVLQIYRFPSNGFIEALTRKLQVWFCFKNEVFGLIGPTHAPPQTRKMRLLSKLTGSASLHLYRKIEQIGRYWESPATC
jgi:hypothetical protein